MTPSRLSLHALIACTIVTATPAGAVPSSTPALDVQTPADALKAATGTARRIEKATGTTPPKQKMPDGDPCTALPLAEVQRLFPGTKAGEKTGRLDGYGINECIWKGSKGAPVLVLQESFSRASARDEALGMARGFVDPLKRNALTNVRIETFSVGGVDNAAFVETADPKRGILGDGALLMLRNGERLVSIAAPELPERDRTTALKALETLARLASPRVQAGP